MHRRYLTLLGLLTADARERGSLQEALHTLELAREEDPYDESRYVSAAHLLVAAGRRGTAIQIAQEARDMLADIAVRLPELLRSLLN